MMMVVAIIMIMSRSIHEPATDVETAARQQCYNTVLSAMRQAARQFDRATYA